MYIQTDDSNGADNVSWFFKILTIVLLKIVLTINNINLYIIFCCAILLSVYNVIRYFLLMNYFER